MHFLFFLSTRLKVFLTEIPPILLFAMAIIYNDSVNSPFKLYPLMVILCALILFIPVYFLRGVFINYEEVRCVGFFSSKEKAIIKEDRTLVLTLLPKRKVRIELFSKNNDGEASFAWLTKEEAVWVNVFRARVNGKEGVIKKALRYFEIDEEVITATLEKDNFSVELERVKVMTDIENESKKVTVYFKETL